MLHHITVYAKGGGFSIGSQVALVLQILDLETGVIGTSDAAYSVFKGTAVECLQKTSQASLLLLLAALEQCSAVDLI